MGKEQSTLAQNGYVLQKETENGSVYTKGDDTFLIKKIILDQTTGNADPALTSAIEILKTTSHPHIVNSKNSFKDKDQKTYYVVMDYCQGGSLAAKITEMNDSLKEFEVLSWIVEICMALRTIHEKDLLHKHLTPENILLTEFGIVCLDGFGKIHENSKNTAANLLEKINYLPPEVFVNGTYDAKSDIWSVGCILYELCTRQLAFSAETTIKMMPKIINGPYPSLKETFSPELCELLNDILNRDPQSRPTASEILERPFIVNCLSKKCKTTVEELQTKLDKLREVADGLERVHEGTTIGSLAGGVIGAVGGITSIVGLILAPFTLGASLIVTGVGVGVGVAGGVTAGVSNITNMVNQSSDRKAIRSLIKELEQKVKAVATWLQEIGCESTDITDNKDSELDENNTLQLGCRAGKCLGGISEAVRLGRVLTIGKTAAQTSRVVRVAEVATGVFSGLFVAVDMFFIAMDAKELHHIRQAKAAEEKGGNVSDKSDKSEAQDQPSQNTTRIRSEIMKFVHSIRQAADELQRILDELKSSISVTQGLH
ncbi:serine/threonine-protein kinase 33-like [Sander lucioperca]|uniref:serine/threonine-protein kinase 33-like n=1 Tax=Sander lucioperca TaxID=283035 RepID=UPI0016537221|nr:serine/threonine-protein kinase 33-like [Sander lucioperca]